jgi:signal transduction histidine kinase
MSIRLRLTLLYSAILALTLIVFGVTLYSIQARDSLNLLQRDLALSSGRLTDAALRIAASPPPVLGQPEPPPPRPFDEFTGEQAFQELREREIVRVLDAAGNLMASPFGRVEDALPLSAEGLAAVQEGEEVWESSTVSGENMLIYSRPIVREGETVFIVQVARSQAERDRNLRTLATTLGVAGILTIVMAFGVGWALSGLSLGPIDRITQTARAIGDERDFTRRVAYEGPPDEVGQLANTFNQMLARLQDAYEKVEHALVMQRQFVADVSHELRTPLTTLRGNLALLRRDPPAPPEEQTDILDDMVEESDRLIRLVHDLLLLARADTERKLAREPVAVQPVLEEAVRQARFLDEERHITLETTPALWLLGDRDALKQLALILLDNALKHSGGNVAIRASRQGAQVEISVQDQGPGIPPEKLAHIFDRFYRGDQAPKAPGFGLGLPIAKALTEGMGGVIAIDSAPGGGSVVSLHFMAAPSP